VQKCVQVDSTSLLLAGSQRNHIMTGVDNTGHTNFLIITSNRPRPRRRYTAFDFEDEYEEDFNKADFYTRNTKLVTRTPLSVIWYPAFPLTRDLRFATTGILLSGICFLKLET
jgi:hypothetical protein